MSTKPTLAYWNVRGLGQPIRLVLAYAGVDFNDKQYVEDDEWFGPKGERETYAKQLDFPNLPFYIDGDVKLTQSVAILRHLARKHKLDGQTEEAKNRIAVLEQQLMDLIRAFYDAALAPNYPETRAPYLENVKAQLEALQKFLGTRQFVTGDSVTYVDFLLYEYLIRILLFAPELYGEFAGLKAFVGRIEQLPRVAEFKAKQGKINLIGYPDKWDAQY